MKGFVAHSCTDSQEVRGVVEEIAKLIRPNAIYLYNHKRTLSGQIASFKLCVIADCVKEAAERQIYREIDCMIPYDIILYTPEEWQQLTDRPDTFAHKISRTGTVVYG